MRSVAEASRIDANRSVVASPVGALLVLARCDIDSSGSRSVYAANAAMLAWIPTKESGLADGSTKVVYVALAGNILVAVAKYATAALSGSSAMLTEAVHSTADTANQILLLIGGRRSRTPADAEHPFGFGMEIYFWSLIVAMTVLLAGGGVSLYQGIQELRQPEPIEAPWLTFGVLAFSALFEGASLLFTIRESHRVVRAHDDHPERTGLWRFIKKSKDPSLYESLLEDSAALVGIGLAAAGVSASILLGLLWADAAASIAIGMLLMLNALVIGRATRSLIVGEAMAKPRPARLGRGGGAATSGPAPGADVVRVSVPANILLVRADSIS